MKTTPTAHTLTKQTRRVIEIVGPAGAGKSTLSKALCRRDQRIAPGVHLSKPGFVPFFIRNTLLFLPLYLRRYRRTRWFDWKETRSMVYLKAWLPLLKRHTSHHTLTLLDDGAIFRLVRLREFGPEITRSQLFESWWNEVFDEWVAALNLVIWLDAPYEVLTQRIDARHRWHRMKGKSHYEMYEFLARYCAAYEKVLANLTANGAALLRFDTHRESPDQIAEKVLPALYTELRTSEVSA
jgi:deoxyadenosine/deoxycytidine kinase